MIVPLLLIVLELSESGAPDDVPETSSVPPDGITNWPLPVIVPPFHV